MMTEKALYKYPLPSAGSLPQLCETLLLQQQSTWPQLADGYASLKEVRIREVRLRGDSVSVHFNPRRIVSTAAKVDPKSVSERKCFLCVENLPSEEKGILYLDEFLILCNPMPIVQKHFTIACVRHVPQGLDGYVSMFVELARVMSPGYSVFYNGPKCGASAPDHKHFQAGPIGVLPIEQVAADSARRKRKLATGTAGVFTLSWIDRPIFIIEGERAGDVEGLFSKLLTAMRSVCGVDDEPKVNLLCSYLTGMWRLIVFPRARHRPDAFFKTGDEQILISPAATDVGGILVTPREQDFSRLDAKTIQKIFDEIFLDEATVERIISVMRDHATNPTFS